MVERYPPPAASAWPMGDPWTFWAGTSTADWPAGEFLLLTDSRQPVGSSRTAWYWWIRPANAFCGRSLPPKRGGMHAAVRRYTRKQAR
jgi:hypothetical protein